MRGPLDLTALIHTSQHGLFFGPHASWNGRVAHHTAHERPLPKDNRVACQHVGVNRHHDIRYGRTRINDIPAIRRVYWELGGVLVP